MRSTISSSATTPGSTRPCTSAGKAVSRPITPFGAAGNGTSFSAGWCGAWSVAMQSIVPSRRPSMSACRCGSAASGGLILKRAASSVSTSSSVSSRWCGEASAETSTPQLRASRTSSTDSSTCRWQMCSGRLS